MKKKGRGRQEKKRQQDRLADIVLEKWLNAQHSASLISPPEGSTKHIKKGTKWVSQEAEKSCEKANIFVVKPELYAAFYNSSEVYTTTDVAGLDWTPPGSKKSTLEVEAESKQYIERVREAGQQMPVPDPARWPFPHMWISFAEGVPLNPIHLAFRLQKKTMDTIDPEGALLLGQLWATTDKGPLILDSLEVGILPGHLHPEPYTVLGTCWSTAYTPQAGWKHPLDLNPWICNAIHHHLADFKQIVVERNWRPHQAKQLIEPPGTIVIRPTPPKPYYVVKLQSQVIERNFRESMKQTRRRVELSHRFPVRGHSRIRIRRGPLPLPAREKELLAKRRYSIYTINPLSAEHAALLADRGIPGKKANEWMAILVSWVRNYEKGPEDKPLIPSIRLA
jgi:hypothetical protein